MFPSNHIEKCPFCGYGDLRIVYLNRSLIESNKQDLYPESRKIICVRCNKFFISISLWRTFYEIGVYKRDYLIQIVMLNEVFK